MEIGQHRIGQGEPCYVIAEMSANHGQDFGRAVAILEAAKEAGADAIKLQTYTADTITLNCSNPTFQIEGTIWKGQNLHRLYQEAQTPWEWHPKLQEIAQKLGLDFFSSPFDETAVDFLESLQVPAYKIASFEIVDIPLLEKVASTRKPVIVSTGMATSEEIVEALQTLRRNGAGPSALLKCSSAYPAPPEEMNLRIIPKMEKQFQVPVGLSDHTLGITVPLAAVSLGACILEKHLTLSRQLPSPDKEFSLEPKEFQGMVQAIREIEKALGSERLGPSDREYDSRKLRRSLFVVQDIRAGQAFTKENVRSIRPGHGMHTRYYEQVLGHRATQDLAMGTPLQPDHVEGLNQDQAAETKSKTC